MSPNSNNKTFFKQLLNYFLYLKTCAVIKPGSDGLCSSFVCRTSMVSLFISSDGCYAIKVSVTAVCRLLVCIFEIQWPIWAKTYETIQ